MRTKLKPPDEFMFAERDFEVRLTPAHCRAARGWLGWTQAELSRRSGVGTTAIKNYENEKRQTHKGVQLLLQNAFAKEGVWCSPEGIWDEKFIDPTDPDQGLFDPADPDQAFGRKG